MSNIQITDLNTKHTENIIEIFFNTFKNYPLMQYFFGDSYKQSMKHLVESMCNETSISDNLLLGAFIEGKLQGVAFITPPEKPNNNDFESTPTSSEEEFAKLIGEDALMRLEAYSNLKKANKPSSPHFYINALGVHPQSQGKGIGSTILSQVHHMSEQHSDSQSVALDTQTQKNVGYYQRFDYGISNKVELENVKNWFMFRPNSL
ncbi:MAG: GNAT family N-acetyltransferase [Rivularia sp. (in: cyanobacteria)]